ncbi:recombination protein NinB [Nitrosomonas sp. Nm166]|uniref:recombination protein NinB n=1 Tax=Nitrosomonas sp. Nm166 TaxID=1881054 RepID=UPI0008E0861A|nr:recombination protein NinB [Nitrosomonas sp. Nm166]SFE11083.1 NinB protein [Nitrosomonas sp. Nm166]
MITRPKIPKFSTLIVSERQKEILATKIMNLPVDEENPIQVVISEQVKQRGLDQNAYYWKRMTEISEQAFSNGRQYNADIWHEYCKRHIMPDQVETKNGEMVSKWIEMPDGTTVVISTTQLSKKQFASYTEMCEAFGASLGVIFSANPGFEDR